MPSKRILILSFYYPPEISAGAFRMKSLVDALDEVLGSEYQIDVMTATPVEGKSFQVSQFGANGQHQIFRIGVPDVGDNYMGSARKFISFAKGVMQQTKKTDYNLVIASSSRLLTAILGAYIAKRGMAKYIYDVRDLFVENMAWVMPRGFRSLGRFVFGKLESYAVKHAVMINLVSPGFVDYFVEHYPQARYTTYTNGIDSIFIENVVNAPTDETENKHGTLNIVYAGNIGLAQCLDKFVPAFAKALEDKVTITIIGSGRAESELMAELDLQGVRNVKVIPNVVREELVRFYQQADVLLLHIDDLAALEKVLPSKLFEYAATGKPILAGVKGYAEEFIKLNVKNATCFKPCDTPSAIQGLSSLNLVCERRYDFIEKFNRKTIMNEMACKITKEIVA